MTEPRNRKQPPEGLAERLARAGKPRQPAQASELADHFRKAKASLDQVAKDIAALRRRGADLTRRSG